MHYSVLQSRFIAEEFDDCTTWKILFHDSAFCVRATIDLLRKVMINEYTLVSERTGAQYPQFICNDRTLFLLCYRDLDTHEVWANQRALRYWEKVYFVNNYDIFIRVR